MTEEIEKLELSDEDRAEMQSHYPYAGLQLNELSTQEERLVHFFLRGMSKAAAGPRLLLTCHEGKNALIALLESTIH